MANFRTEVDVDIDIYVDDFLDKLTKEEFDVLISMLKDDYGYFIIKTGDKPRNLIDSDIEECLLKINQNRFKLTIEEENFIKKIGDRF